MTSQTNQPERQAMNATFTSPMSFVGATRRTTALLRKITSKPLRITAWVAAVLLWFPCAYCFLACWYVIVFGLFGIITFPFRAIRRSQRKSVALQQAQLEALQKLSAK